MKVKTFGGFTCSQNLFARLIGKSAAAVYYFRNLGIVEDCRAGILIFRSLDNYFNSYLPPELRGKEISAAIKNLAAIFPAEKLSCRVHRRAGKLQFLQSARRLQDKITAAEIKLKLLIFLQRLDARAVSKKLIDAAKLHLQHLKDNQQETKNNLRRAILAAKIRPVQIETVLLNRYVDCEKFKSVAENFGYSLSYTYTLHRQGRNIFVGS